MFNVRQSRFRSADRCCDLQAARAERGRIAIAVPRVDRYRATPAQIADGRLRVGHAPKHDRVRFGGAVQ
jgi:hypothetical protein